MRGIVRRDGVKNLAQQAPLNGLQALLGYLQQACSAARFRQPAIRVVMKRARRGLDLASFTISEPIEFARMKAQPFRERRARGKGGKFQYLPIDTSRHRLNEPEDSVWRRPSAAHAPAPRHCKVAVGLEKAREALQVHVGPLFTERFEDSLDDRE